MNDSERKDWVLNDEGLYLGWKWSKLGITTWIRRNRQEIDEYINRVLAIEPR
jgi:hypothetical protein